MANSSESDTELFTVPRLAKRAGISRSTVRNWAAMPVHPLQVADRADGKQVFTLDDLETFCRDHPGLPKVPEVLQNLHRDNRQTAPNADPDLENELHRMRSVARSLRVAVQANLSAAIEAARLAEETARNHRAQLEELATGIAALDTILSDLTAPDSLND